MTDLAGAVAGLSPDSGIRVGKVTQVVPLKVNVGGGEVEEAGSLAYVAVGDSVAMIRQGQTWLVLGVVSPATARWGVMAGVRGSGTFPIAAGASSSVTDQVNMFSLPRTPSVVVCNFGSKPSSQVLTWWMCAVNLTATGFTTAAYGPATTNAFTIPFQYIALL